MRSTRLLSFLPQDCNWYNSSCEDPFYHVLHAQVLTQVFAWCQHWTINPGLIETTSLFTSPTLHAAGPQRDHLHLQGQRLGEQVERWWGFVVENHHHGRTALEKMLIRRCAAAGSHAGKSAGKPTSYSWERERKRERERRNVQEVLDPLGYFREVF